MAAKSCKFSKPTKGGPVDRTTGQPDPPPMLTCMCAGKATKITACAGAVITEAYGFSAGPGIVRSDRKNPKRGFIAASGLGGKALTVTIADAMTVAGRGKETNIVVTLKDRAARKRK